MKLNRKLVILIIPMFLLQAFMFETIEGSTTQEIDFEQKLQASPANTPIPEIIPPGAGGEDALRTNIFPDGSFDETDGIGGPTNFYYGGGGHIKVDPAYQGDVFQGSYAYQISAEGTEQFSETATTLMNLGVAPFALVNQGITFDFYYKINNPGITMGGEVVLDVSFYNGSLYRLYYYLSTNAVLPGNTTTRHYINLNNTQGFWNHFNRNLTSDYIDAFGSPGASTYFYYFRFDSFSDVDPVGVTEVILDNMQVYNSTNYQYVTNNWDFEDGTGNYWSYYFSGPSSCMITNADSTEGDSSLNLTSYSLYQSAQSYVYAEKQLAIQSGTPPKSYYAENPGDFVIEFDWKYSDVTNGGIGQNAMFYVISQSSSHYYYNFFILGNGEDSIIYTNTTGDPFIYRYFTAESYGVRDTWNQFSLDLYDLYQSEGIVDAPVIYAGFETRSGLNANATTTLLIDEMTLKTYPTGDPSFEIVDGWSSTNPLPSWINSGSDIYTNITEDAHTGNYAANISTTTPGTSLAYRLTHIEVDVNLYTDFWWKINTMSSLGTSNSLITLQINDIYYLYYVLGSSSSFSGTNSSNHAYFYVDKYNTTGVWNNLVRNVYNDALSAFGSTDWNITRVTISTNSIFAYVSTIFDDMHFVKDTIGPNVYSINQQNTPNYYEDAIIDYYVEDLLSSVDTTNLYYQTDTTWYKVSAADIGGDAYRAIIPMDDYGVVYYYYINSTDIYGNVAIDDNSGLYYTYTVGDNIAPSISITAPINNTEVSGTIEISVDSDDVGSGIHYVDFLDGWTLIEQDSSAPYSIFWDTRTVANGIHEINCVAHDNAGNTKESKILLDCQNDLDEPAITNLNQTPAIPNYDSVVTIEVTVTDDSAIDIVELHYKTGDDSWDVAIMTVQVGSIYAATIPTQSWTTEVLYYITARDSFDQASTLGTILNPFSYIVDDSILPELSITGPDTDGVHKGKLEFSIVASDIGSGIKYFVIEIDAQVIINETSVTATFEWNTRGLTDGYHVLEISVTDNAGNTKTLYYNYYIDNPPLATIISLISLGTIATIGIAVTVVIFVRKKRVA